MKKSKKFLIETNVLLSIVGADIVTKMKKTGKGIKEYFYEEETIKHISLILYDLLPLSVKIGMRYEKFHDIFSSNFKGIRNSLFGEDSKIVEEVEKPVKKVRKSRTTSLKKPTAKVSKVKLEK